MAELRRFGILDAVLFLAIVLGAGGIRAWYLAACADNGNTSSPILVQDPAPSEQEALLRNLRENNSYSAQAPLAESEELTAHTAPGYPWLLSMLQRAMGDEKSGERMARWIQCGLGALTAGLYFLFARRAFRSLIIGTLAGILCALHPFWVINTAEVNDGVLATFLLALSLFLGARGGQAGGAFTSLLYGLALAGLALVRAALLPFAIVALLWYLVRSRTLQRGWLCGFLALLGFVNGLAPWMLRNMQSMGDVLPIVDSTYLHLWEGNNRSATGGPETEQQMREALTADEAGIQPKELAELPQKERYKRLGRLAVDEARKDPAGTVKRRLRAGIAFLVGDDFLTQSQLSESVEGPSLPGWLNDSYPCILPVTLLGMLVLGVIGWRWTYGWRFEALPASLAVLWIPLPYLLGHAEALSGPRLPLDGVFLCYAAFVLTCLNPNMTGYLLRGGTPERQDEERKPARLP